MPILNDFFSTPVDFKKFSGQFILTTENTYDPIGWNKIVIESWHLYTYKLPVLNVVDQNNRWLGWCIGYPIINSSVQSEKIILSTDKIEFDMSSIDDFYQNASGKWALLLVHPEYNKIFLDPYGSLSMVYSTIEKTIASTSSLLGNKHEWDTELINVVGLPEVDNYLPAGLTTKKFVNRLLPNHSLNVNLWKVSRHWPTPDTDLTVDTDIQSAVEKIAENIKSSINAAAKISPLCFSLTAGMDSRMILACAREHLNTANFFTFSSKRETVDMHIPRHLSKRFNLNHKFLEPIEATPLELAEWLQITGLSSSGAIWRIHKTLENLEPHRILLPGTAGEVGRRTKHWRKNDSIETAITPEDVLKRCRLPNHPRLIKAAKEWLDELYFLDTFSILALMFIEQRLACWASPQHYGNRTSPFEFTPFNSRKIFHITMRLPFEYRRNKKLPYDICRYTWPELLEFPFNEFTGLKGFFYSKARRIKRFLKGA